MPDKYHTHRCIVITLLLSSIMVGVTSFEKPAPAEQTLEAIKDCISRTPSQWPNEWKKEYIETIRSVVESHRDVPHYMTRLEILNKGFAPYWESFTKTQDRSLFEVYRTRMRWYTEHLMGTKFPTAEERQNLRDQYTDIWDHSANSLLTQFPFLDPNAVDKAKADDLSECYRKIDAPLTPVYLRPLSEAQVERIKQRWDNLRYARVDLLRRLVGNSTTPAENSDAPSSNAERDYQLTKESLSQLLGLVWKVVPERPDYYLEAIKNRIESIKFSIQLKRQARLDQQQLEKECSKHLLQTEHIGFVMSALLETLQYYDGTPYIITKEKNPLEKQDKTMKGGGAYEVVKDQTEN